MRGCGYLLLQVRRLQDDSLQVPRISLLGAQGQVPPGLQARQEGIKNLPHRFHVQEVMTCNSSEQA